MNNWALLKEIFASATIYWRKFFVFILVTAIILTGAYLFNQQKKSLASQKSIIVDNSSSSINSGLRDETLMVEVKSNGQVMANGKDISNTLKIRPNYYEIKIIAIDASGDFVGDFLCEMTLPQDVQPNEVEQIIYAVHGVGENKPSMKDSRTLVFQASEIEPFASVAIEARLPKYILTPSLSKVIVFELSQIPAKSYIFIALFFPLATLILLIIMILKRRRDQLFGLGNNMLTLPPEDISPAIVGALIEGQVGAREIAAILIDLANRGYIFINSRGNSFSFGKRKSLDMDEIPDLKDFEKVLLSKIFETTSYKSTRQDVEMRIGRHIFSRKIAKVYLEIYNEATRLGHFVSNPALVHMRWRYTGIFLFFASFVGFILNAIYAPDPKYVLILWVGGMLVASVVIKLSSLMPIRTVSGSMMAKKWLMFEKYLKLPRPIEPKVALIEIFSRYLPYAIVMGVEVEWAKRFMVEPFIKPVWYESEDSVVALETFVGGLYPIISYVGTALDKSKEPTID